MKGVVFIIEDERQIVINFLNSMGWENAEIVEVPSLFVEEPKLSTGCNDNFNAGLRFGQLVGLNIHDSLHIANAISGYYVRNARSPSM